MRAAPIGLIHSLQPTPWELRRDAVLSAVPTHTNTVGVAGAAAIAAAVAWLIRASLQGVKEIESRAFLSFVSEAIGGMEPTPSRERRPGGTTIRLAERISEVSDLVQLPSIEDALTVTWNGAYALESVPAALCCFLRSPDDPRAVILAAVNAGRDADTVASIAGNLVGAWCGADRLREVEADWWNELEYRDELIRLADGLTRLALKEA